MAKSRDKRIRASLTAFATWHRRLGIAAALLVGWLAVSGVLLNHTDAIGLDDRHTRAGWLLDWYGIDAPGEITGFHIGEHWLTQVGERIYFDDRPLPGEHRHLSGAVYLDGEIAAVTAENILLLTRDGRLAEALGAVHGVPRGIEQVGVQDGRLVVRTPQGLYAAATGMVQWRAATPQDTDWARPGEVPNDLRARLSADYRARVLTLERVLLDLHSGRLLGPVGVVLMDLAAVALLLLAGTGVWMWFMRNNNGRRGRKTRASR